MTKAEAMKILISRYQNELIAQDFEYIDDEDKAICKALKIDII